MRRRVALLSGVHLNLPNSPVVGPSPPGTARELAWTFTAEWDSTQDEFIFSDLESSSSGSSNGSSASSPRFFRHPIPLDVSEDDIFSPLGKVSIAARLQELASLSASSSSSSSSASSSASCSPSSPAVTDIFDLYTSRTPNTHSFSFSDPNDSSSTASSSPLDTPSPRLSPSSYKEGRFDPPVISVTFYDDDESERVAVNRVVVAPASAFESASWQPLLHETPSPQRPHSAGIPRKTRPLPPVPIRTVSLAQAS